jgi:hypothetical protein
MKFHQDGSAHIAAAPNDLIPRFALSGVRAEAEGRQGLAANRQAETVSAEEAGAMIGYLGGMAASPKHVHGRSAAEALVAIGQDAAALEMHGEAITGALFKAIGLEGEPPTTAIEALSQFALVAVDQRRADFRAPGGALAYELAQRAA